MTNKDLQCLEKPSRLTGFELIKINVRTTSTLADSPPNIEVKKVEIR